jgi:hypothetical protein
MFVGAHRGASHLDPVGVAGHVVQEFAGSKG